MKIFSFISLLLIFIALATNANSKTIHSHDNFSKIWINGEKPKEYEIGVPHDFYPQIKQKYTDPKEIKKLPKYDRPDLAFELEKVKTMDPSLGYVPSERKFEAYKYTQNLIKSRKKHDVNNMMDPITGVSWTERGPDNVGGRTRALMWDPNDAANSYKKVWAGGVAGGLWYNEDITSSSSQWQNVDDFWANLAISTIAYDPGNTDIFYVGTGEGWYNADAVRGNGIWKSTDGGDSWNQLSSTDNSNFNHVQKIEVTSDGYIIAACGNGLYTSTDGGSTFNREITGFFGDVEIASNGDIYAAKGRIFTTGQIYKSTDDGATWSATSMPSTNVYRIELACAPSNSNVVYALCESSSNYTLVECIAKSTDGGSSWTNVTVPGYTEQNCYIGSNDFTRGQAWYDIILAVRPNDENTVIVGGIDLYKSTNGGTNWDLISYWTGSCDDYVHADQHAIEFRPNSNDEAIFGTDGGVFYSTNAGSASDPDFYARNNGYNVTQFYSCSMVNSEGSDYLVGGTQDNGSHKFTSSGMNSTEEITGGDGGFSFIDQDESNIWITSYVYNYWRVSTNSGSSFQYLGINTGRFINPADYDSETNTLYAAAGNNQFYRISDVGGSNSRGAVSVSIGNRQINAVKVSPYTDNRIFVAASGYLYEISNAHTSSPSVTQIGQGSRSTSGYISCIEIGSSENQLLITYTNYGLDNVWETTDGGTTWTSKDGNLPDMPVRWALYNPDNRDEVMLATEVGVWSTNDFSVSSPDWDPTNTGLSNARTDMLKYRDSDKLVLAATHGRGLYTTDAFDACPENLTVSDINIDGDESDVANNIITTSGNNSVLSGGSYQLIAGSSVKLNPGFHSENGSSFQAYTDADPCNLPSPIALPDDEDTFTDIFDTENEEAYRVFPNPTRGIINITISSNEVKDLEVEVYNVLGNLVHKETQYFSSQLHIDITNQTQGVYHLKIKAGGNIYTEKIILRK